MRKVKIAAVMIGRAKMTPEGPLWNAKGEVITEDHPMLLGALLDELVWGDEQFSASAGAAGCFERWGETLGEAAEGDEFEMTEEDHELIAKKLQEWPPKDANGKKPQGNKNTRRVRQLVNAFVFTPKLEAKPPKALAKEPATNGAEAPKAAESAPA